MARALSPERFGQLVEAATKTFVSRGYRLTQMADIAEALGVAKGTLYGYVESKEALFDAVLRFADGHQPALTIDALPYPTPPAGSTVAYVRARLTAEGSRLALLAVAGKRVDRRGAWAELETILRDLYRSMARNRRALKVLDRCAADYPELAALFFDEGRWHQVDLLAEYLERRIVGGHFRNVPNAALAARVVLETIATWAIHMPWDPAPRAHAELDAENTVVDMLLHAITKEKARD